LEDVVGDMFWLHGFGVLFGFSLWIF